MAQALPAINIPNGFPFRDVFVRFADEYRTTNSYWYVPRARALTRANVAYFRELIDILINEFITVPWTIDEQNRLVDILQARGLMEPYVPRPNATPNDRAARARIQVAQLRHLGFAWGDGAAVVVTEAGLELAIADEPDDVVTNQIAKIQYPNPSLVAAYRDLFDGLFPHMFLLQVLAQADYRVTDDEFMLFVNLAQRPEDLNSVVQYIRAWRATTDEQQALIKGRARHLQRWETIYNQRHYAVAEYTYPPYLTHVEGETRVIDRLVVDELVAQAPTMKPVTYRDEVDWFAYLGDPKQRPDWFTYLRREVERAETGAEAGAIIAANAHAAAALSADEKADVDRAQREKLVEDFYVEHLDMLEPGLTLVENGRQFTTETGPMDLLCRGADGAYVVVEIKADEAGDSAFGQILRYMGWVNVSLTDGNNNVRGILLAGGFPTKAVYSRMGLLKPNAEQFIQFKKHRLTPETVIGAA
jgi:hypothetical protein